MERFEGEALVRGRSVRSPVLARPPVDATEFVYVTPRLSARDYDVIQRCSAVVCEEGGRTDHGAVMCRILGRPLIRLRAAVERLADGELISLDGRSGELSHGPGVDRGAATVPEGDHELACIIGERRLDLQVSIISAAEIALVNRGVDDPLRCQVREFFVREEMLWAAHGHDPLEFIAEHGLAAAANFLARHLGACLRWLRPGQLLNYRALDWRAEDGTECERNPELGLHGIRRLLVEPELLRTEFRALEILAAREIVFSLPFVTGPEELEAVQRLAKGLEIAPVRFGVFIETPAAVTEVEELIARDASRMYVGTKDLTQMILACDRSNARVEHLYDCTKRPVVEAIRQVLHAGADAGVPVVVFTLLDDLPRMLECCPELHAISICCGEYLELASAWRQGKRKYQFEGSWVAA